MIKKRDFESFPIPSDTNWHSSPNKTAYREDLFHRSLGLSPIWPVAPKLVLGSARRGNWFFERQIHSFKSGKLTTKTLAAKTSRFSNKIRYFLFVFQKLLMENLKLDQTSTLKPPDFFRKRKKLPLFYEFTIIRKSLSWKENLFCFQPASTFASVASQQSIIIININ